MHCLRCSQAISERFFAERSKTDAFKGGRFGCPHCGAEHIRREVGRLPSGEPMYNFRLWGHLTTAKREPAAASSPGPERRQARRLKPWR